MECPLCASRALARDHASPRAWVLLGLGTMLLLGCQVLLPVVMPLLLNAASASASMDAEDLRRALLAAEKMNRGLLFAGLGCALLGAIDIMFDCSRYCLRCGFRGRFPRRRLDGPTAAAVSHLQNKTRSARPESGSSSLSGGPSRSAPPLGEQPVAPLIRMLRMKNPEMRRDAADTLSEVTGQDFGEDAEAWQAWWDESRKGDVGDEV